VLVGSEAWESAAEGGTVDHGFMNGAVPYATHCVGAGPMLPPPGDLGDAADALLKGKPLGFVRLIVVDVGDNTPRTRFISKLRPMIYPVARYLWALRRLPIADNLRVFFRLYATQSTLQTDELTGAPDSLPSTLTGKDPTTGNDVVGLWESHILRGEPNGKVIVGRHKEEAGAGKTGWVDDLEVKKPLPEKPRPEHLNGAALLAPAGMGLRIFCFAKAHLGDTYVAKPGDTSASIKSDYTTGVAFFDG
jgi:hypothetical protein